MVHYMSDFAAIVSSRYYTLIGSGLHLKTYGAGWGMEGLKPSGPVLVGYPHGKPAV